MTPTPFLPSAAPGLLQAVLEVSLTGFILFRPLYGPTAPATIVDLAYVYLNPAAQRALSLPEQPAESFLTLYPGAVQTDVFAFYRDTFLSGEAGHYDINYQLDKLDNYYHLAARRYDDWLLVSFSDTADQPRTAVELALRVNQAHEQAARAEDHRLNVDLQRRFEQARRHAQAAAAAATQRQAQERAAFHHVFEQTSALVALLRGPSHCFEYVNSAYQSVFPGRQLVGSDMAVAVPELHEQGFIAVLDGVYQTGETYYHTDVPFVLAATISQTARTAYYNITYQASRESDRVAGVSIFAFDVTEQVLARQEREGQRQQLHNLFMQAPAAVCILDGPDLVYELVNPGYQALFPGRVLLGRRILDALPELADHASYRTFREVFETGITHMEKGINIPLARPDGVLEDRYFYYIQQARRDRHGQPDGVLVFAFEVTEQVRDRQQALALTAELTTANQQLIRTNVDLDTFIYTASHDLRQPISNIEGLLSLLRSELPAPGPTLQSEVPRILDMMQESVERFQRTIEYLTDISKLQREFGQPVQSVPLALVIEGVRLDLAPLLHDSHGRLDVDVRAVPTLPLSEKNLRSVVFNLLSNALKYHHPGRPPVVRVGARLEGHYVVLEIRDNGLGFDVALEKQLFGLFQRLHTHVEGSGVGLYMVKRVVENAGGHIVVQSQVGEGATFSVYLPR